MIKAIFKNSGLAKLFDVCVISLNVFKMNIFQDKRSVLLNEPQYAFLIIFLRVENYNLPLKKNLRNFISTLMYVSHCCYYPNMLLF